MSSYFHRVKAKAIVDYLELYEKRHVMEDSEDGSNANFDDHIMSLLMEDFRRIQSNGHLDTNLNMAWTAFQTEYREDPRSALNSARRLHSLLLARYAPDERAKFYRDSNTIIIDGQAFYGFSPEQFCIFEYLWMQGAQKWTPVRVMKEEIELLKINDVSDRTILRHINDPELCPEIRNLIQEQRGKGHRLILPPMPLRTAE